MKKQKPRGNKYRQLAETCAEMIARGCSITGTAADHKIARATLYNWLETEDFRDLVKYKKDEWRMELLGRIQEAGKQPHLWTANAWLLERCKAFEGEYAPPNVRNPGQVGNIVVQVAVGHPRAQLKDQDQGQEQITEAKMVDHDDEKQGKSLFVG